MKRLFFALLFAVSFSTTADAQISGQTLGGCPERIFIGPDAIAVATAYSMASEGERIRITVGRGDGAVQASTFDCSNSLSYAYCTDGLLFGIIDPIWAGVGGVVGLGIDIANGERSLLGGLIGSGVAGLGAGVIQTAQCRERQAGLAPTADAVLKDLNFTLNGAARPSGAKEAIRNRTIELARARAISASDAEAFLGIFDAVTAQLTP